ncbi:SDR family NAD(P)-dependent oxidoreductase [Pseudomonas typographi]|uniref:SDR family NAD(P)-dependent oxidoreductase n=1 Tax=Pseudomonas typographi TaxID=2715964 RepID=A0ABR7Z914_9PSED|nr:SDR family NAD(P)-dependent oxidoreductase [Pseudomonas typographi]MBD1554450.1 SDR family NAD(P)-dependent oxidoreductase [Pseudomonas typographi]MBD1589938.1 SDR family NAD(P)-dependent oxidoreductase [Pseudomonas typographi]MBD1602041.1 SDR family NAD(P)-dependent oxidoreductase [Pseudomonas typographi]
MAHKQSPIHSGFGAHTTAAEVLEGRDLHGVTAMVTGGHSGLGLETTRALASAGAHVIVAARDPGAARPVLAGLGNVVADRLDLADLASVRDFAGRFLATGRHLDMLIGSAGIMACPETRRGPGWEAQFATNHLGHYALVNLLWPALKGGARVVVVSSAGHHQSAIRWADVHFTQGYDKWLAYGQSKTANALFAVHLDRLGQHEGVRAFSLHPGKIFTPLQRHITQGEMVAAGWLDASGQPADPTFKTAQQGAATQVWAATSAQLQAMGGVYCEDCEIAEIDASEPPSFVGVRPYAADPVQAERLWALSATLTGIDVFSLK